MPKNEKPDEEKGHVYFNTELVDMIFAKVDVDFPDHPKFLGVKDPYAILGLWLRGLCYSRKFLLDGKIPKAALTRFPGGGRANIPRAKVLVELGLWVDAGDHYFDPNYEGNGNTSRVEVEGHQERNREKQAEYRARNQSSNRLRSTLTLALSESEPESLQAGGGERERGDQPEAEPTREQDYQRAYELGIAEGKGSPYAMPEVQRGALHQGILAHSIVGGRKVRGQELLDWITRQARQFAEWLVKQDRKTIGIYSSYGPRGWLNWLNSTPVRGAKPIVTSAIANAASRLPDNDVKQVQASVGQPAPEKLAQFNVAQLTANLAKGWKP